jgi:hypothetical protein
MAGSSESVITLMRRFAKLIIDVVQAGARELGIGGKLFGIRN